MADIIPFRRRTRLPKEWAHYRSSRRRWREVRLMVEAGLLIGLSVFGLTQYAGAHLPAIASAVGAAPTIVDVPSQAVNPYAVSEQSRAILAAQEGTPTIALAGARSAELARPSAVRVIDGDTFDYDGDRIRIADIDTPEVRGRCPEERAQAARATQRLRALLAAGPFELVRSGRDEDRYGRKLRVVVRDGRSIGDMLVGEGLARTWSGRREPWC